MANSVMIDTHIQDVAVEQLNTEINTALGYDVSLLVEFEGDALSSMQVTRIGGGDISEADQTTIRSTLDTHTPI